MRMYRVVCVVVMGLMMGCGPTSNGSKGDNNQDEEGSGSGIRVSVPLGAGYAPDPDWVRAIALDDGGVITASYTITPEGAAVEFTRLDDQFAAIWATRLVGVRGELGQIAIDRKDRLVLSVSTSQLDTHLSRLDASTGALLDTAIIQNASSRAFAPLDGGGLMLADGVELSDDLTPVRVVKGRGEGVVRLRDGGFVFGSARELGPGTAGSGASLIKVDASGELVWKAFATPGPGRHELVGVTQFEDGTLFVAMTNEAADSRNVASLKPLITFTFSEDGQLATSRAHTYFSGTNLSFGGAISMAADRQRAYVGLIANSGALGSDIRQQVLSVHDSSGEILSSALMSGGVGRSPNGKHLVSYHYSGAVTRAPNAEALCLPNAGGSSESFEPTYEDRKDGEEVIFGERAVTDFEKMSAEVMSQERALQEAVMGEAAPSCASP